MGWIKWTQLKIELMNWIKINPKNSLKLRAKGLKQSQNKTKTTNERKVKWHGG